MATEVIIPALGVITEKVKIITWFKSEGDPVEQGEPLLEIESDKVTTEIAAPSSGILGCILYPVGAEVPITKVAAVIVAPGEAVPASYRQQLEEGPPLTPSAVPPSAPPAEKVSKPVKAAPAARKFAEEKGVDLSLVTPTGPHETIMKKDVEAYLAAPVSEKKPPRVSPVAQKVAADLQISVNGVQGTGVQGKIMKADVLKAAEESKSPTKEEGPFGKTLAMSKMRQVIARRLSGSAFTAPHIYLFTDVNMEKAIDLRDSILEDFERKFHVRLSINDFLIKAVSLAIRDYPLLNAMIRGDEIYIHPEINVGLAVALEDGLIVPAMTQVDRLGLGAIAQQRADLVGRARQGKLTLNEIERGTFTISSLANFDIRFFTAIINPPQSGILSVGKIEDQLYREKGEVKERKVVHLGLSVDHRIIDGAVAARFLQTIKKTLENPSFYFLNL